MTKKAAMSMELIIAMVILLILAVIIIMLVTGKANWFGEKTDQVVPSGTCPGEVAELGNCPTDKSPVIGTFDNVPLGKVCCVGEGK